MMYKPSKKEIAEKLRLHKLWADTDGAEGERADFSNQDLFGANLKNANLKNANFAGAHFENANFAGAHLEGADFAGAHLDGANFFKANLTDANLEQIKKDFFEKLSLSKNEVEGLYQALSEGKIDGYCYEGECCCFVGTIANLQDKNFKELNGLKPDANSPTETWFLAFREGDTPKNSQVADITAKWIKEFQENNDNA